MQAKSIVIFIQENKDKKEEEEELSVKHTKSAAACKVT
jgi:hypothetical protein